MNELDTRISVIKSLPALQDSLPGSLGVSDSVSVHGSSVFEFSVGVSGSGIRVVGLKGRLISKESQT